MKTVTTALDNTWQICRDFVSTEPANEYLIEMEWGWFLMVGWRVSQSALCVDLGPFLFQKLFPYAILHGLTSYFISFSLYPES
jgi:hypothetical protein